VATLHFLPATMSDRKALRRRLRAARAALAPAERARASRALAWHVLRSPWYLRARRIAFYLPNDGEVDLQPLLLAAWQAGKQCFLPVLGGRWEPRLWFMPWTPGDDLVPNRYGILEPPLVRGRRTGHNWALDLVLVPLVAVDRAGHRLGMGGGFYDRTFAYLRARRHWRRPHLMGTAFSFQQVDHLEPAPWDVPLDSLATERGVVSFPGRDP